MRIQAISPLLSIGILMVSAVGAVFIASAGSAQAKHPPVAMADDATSTVIVQDICVDAGLEVKLFIHAAGRSSTVTGMTSRVCDSDDENRKARAAAAVTTRLSHDAMPHNPLQEQS